MQWFSIIVMSLLICITSALSTNTRRAAFLTKFVSARTGRFPELRSKCMMSNTASDEGVSTGKKGKLLVLGGTGFLGQAVCKRAALEGYLVTSISRRGRPPGDSTLATATNIEYLEGDCRQKSTVIDILKDGSFTGIIHCVGLLFDDASGLGQYNRFASGSGSLPDSGSTYDSITRLTACNAIEAATEVMDTQGSGVSLPFCFTSAAEAGWSDLRSGSFIENTLAPDFLKRYLAAKRAVEEKLLASEPSLRPVIFRPSLIYTLDRPASFPAVGAFFVGNKIGLPFVDQPVSVQALANSMVRAISQPDVKGILRYKDINALSE